MTINEKRAIKRIMLDLVKADTVINARELEVVEEIKEKYRITDEAVVESHKITYAQALKDLAGLSRSEKDELFGDLKRMSQIDGQCCRLEAIMLLAVEFMFSEDMGARCDVGTSDPVDYVMPMTILYIESSYDEETNAQIKEHFREIVAQFKLVGFDFRYIPATVERFNKMRPEFLKSLIRCLSPTIDLSQNESIYNKLISATTVDFCRDLLYNKMSTSMVNDTEPAMLIKIGASMVTYTPKCSMEDCAGNNFCRSSMSHANVPLFLKVNVGENIMDDVYTIIDRFKALTSENSITIDGSNVSDEFYYSGFMKNFFDVLAFPSKQVESKIVIDPNKRKIEFKDLGEYLNVTAFLRAFYVFLIYAHVTGKTVNRNEKSAEKRRRYQKIFNRIYNWVGKADSEAPGYLSDMAPTLAKLRSAIRKVELLKNKKLYEPTSEDEIVSVKIDPMKVYVVDKQTNKEVRMLECKEWLDLGKE